MWWFPDRRQVLLIRQRVEERSRLSADPIVAGLLQPSVLDAAVGRAIAGPWPSNDLWTRLALLLRGIARDHPFADGNKRTGYEVVDTTLMANGYILVASAEAVVGFQLAVAQGELGVEAMAEWLKRHAETIKNDGVEP